jgi:uncharacterized protein YecA (UPF0149 family)
MPTLTEEYACTEATIILTGELAPEGILERTFTREIAAAVNRLDRLAESHLTEADTTETDRSRAAAHNSLRRCIAELRKLQTERATRELIDAELPGLADSQKVLTAVRLLAKMNAEGDSAQKIPNLDNPAALDAFVAAQPVPESSFCKNADEEPEAPESATPNTPNTPRSAPCPCRSGLKFKRCCGKNAPPVLSPGLKEAA